MKRIPNPFNWYPRDFWYWPDEDEKLLQVIDQVHDLDQVLPLIPNKHVCIQAGGACGVWPAYLSRFFDQVFSFEAQYENYICATYNDITENQYSICHIGVGDKEKFDQITTTDIDYEQNNSGAHYISHRSGVPGVNDEDIFLSIIDSFDFDYLDFICLDVEGFEEKALRGAAQTIERCKPVIMIEEKPLPHLKEGEHLKARQYLESIGYKEMLKVHRDVVFKCQ